MTISLSGLDLSFLKTSPPIRSQPPRKPERDLRSPLGGPTIMSDIREFVSIAGEKPELITSRSQLARHERSNNMRQVGNDLKGKVIQREKRRIQAGIDRAKQVGGVKVDAQWV